MPDRARPINLKLFQKRPNVGDQFSVAVARHYFGGRIATVDHDSVLDQPNLVLAGSILEYADSLSYVCGPGFISAESKLRRTPRHVNCVRGPLSGSMMRQQGMPGTDTYGDPGILASRLFPRSQPAAEKIGLVPHYVDASAPWVESCRRQGIHVLDVQAPVGQFLDELDKCEVILSSSLHGIIFAHSYGKSALWVEISDRVLGGGFKFFDYYESIGLSSEDVVRRRVTDQTDPWELATLAQTGKPERLVGGLEDALATTRRQLDEAAGG